MVESLVGLIVMVMVTSFMASLVQLASEILEPKPFLTELDKSIVEQYRFASKSSISEEIMEEEVSKFICKLPRDSNYGSRDGC
jgi:hypothetical protein